MAVTNVRLIIMYLVFVTITCVSSTLTNDLVSKPEIEINEEDLDKILAPYTENEEYIRQIYSMINAYKGDMLARRMEIETNDLIDLKIKSGKRNVDLINSILSLPKGMNDAGR